LGDLLERSSDLAQIHLPHRLAQLLLTQNIGVVEKLLHLVSATLSDLNQIGGPDVIYELFGYEKVDRLWRVDGKPLPLTPRCVDLVAGIELAEHRCVKVWTEADVDVVPLHRPIQHIGSVDVELGIFGGDTSK